MVIGQGLVAKGFSSYQADNSYLVFASGVSNSSDKDITNFEREKKLLIKTINEHADKILVYFSTCSMYDNSLKNSFYVQHKIEMEETIQKGHPHFYIFRISNLAGKTSNRHTVLNYFIRHILDGHFFYVWQKASRNIIDVDDAYAICDHILQNKMYKNEIINIANPVNYPVIAIVNEIERYFDKKGNYELLDKESNPVIDISPIKEIITGLNINFDAGYLSRTIKKYFSNDDI
jgi:nucleoside-diphosphate-sugar epimerase